MKIDIAAYSHIGTRKINEDSVSHGSFGKDKAYAVVCDGLGSHGGGDIASSVAAKILSSYGENSPLPTEADILKWMEKANDEINTAREKEGEMKTTAVALYVDGKRAIWAHTGDSRLYHFHNGKLADYTDDQSLCQLFVMQGMMTRAEIPFSPDKNKVLSVLGTEKINPVIHSEIKLKRGNHAFLLCTDGLWERLGEEEIAADCTNCDSAEELLSHLRTRANLRRHEDVDNNTAVTLIIEV